MDLYTPIVVTIVPVLIALLKSRLSPDALARVKPYLPALAILLGALGDLCAQYAQAGSVGLRWSLLSGLAAVGLREAVKQMDAGRRL
jgi:hypothetical protein